MANSALQDIISDASVQHISAQILSDRTGLDRKTVASILSGETANPKLDTVCSLADALGGGIIYSTKDSRAASLSGDISYYRTMIASAHHEISVKDRWLRWLFFTALGLTGVIVMLSIVLCTFAINS